MNSKRKMTRRGALVATAMAVFATPAFASLVIQNYMEADITLANACFVKVAGDDHASFDGGDADDPLASFSATNTDTVAVEGVDLLQEQLTIRGMIGDRVIYTDVVRYENRCDVDLDITLVASGNQGSGDWADRTARIYISDVPVALGDGTDPVGFPGDLGSEWNATPIVVDPDTGLFSSSQTGTVTVPAGDQIRGAIVVSAGVDAIAGTTGTVNWIAQAVSPN